MAWISGRGGGRELGWFGQESGMRRSLRFGRYYWHWVPRMNLANIPVWVGRWKPSISVGFRQVLHKCPQAMSALIQVSQAIGCGTLISYSVACLCMAHATEKISLDFEQEMTLTVIWCFSQQSRDRLLNGTLQPTLPSQCLNRQALHGRVEEEASVQRIYRSRYVEQKLSASMPFY